MQLLWRATIFLLASLSFACLLGTFYGFWQMQNFACWAYLPAVVILGVVAAAKRSELPSRWIVYGTAGGLIAAVAYDLFRLPFVIAGAPLYKPFPHFGELLLCATEPRWLVYLVGWAYHFSNGAALGIMLLAFVVRPTRKALLYGSVILALAVEAILLLTPYTSFFGIPFDAKFLLLTLSAHLIFGIALGLWLQRRSALFAPGPAVLRAGTG